MATMLIDTRLTVFLEASGWITYPLASHALPVMQATRRHRRPPEIGVELLEGKGYHSNLTQAAGQL